MDFSDKAVTDAKNYIMKFYDKGEIKERGNHQQLLKKRGIYYNLYKIQNMEKKMKEDRRING